MFHMDYQVKGEDVNDYMTMEGHAYFSYSLRHIYNFLFQLGYSRQKLNRLKIHLQEQKSHFEMYKPLMFGNNFKIFLSIGESNDNARLFEVKNRFLNSKNELCAVITSENVLNETKRDGTSYNLSKKILAHFLEIEAIS